MILARVVKTSRTFSIDDEVEITLAVPLFHILEAVPFLGKGPQGFGEELHRVGEDGQFARLRLEDLPFEADDVADVELLENLVCRALQDVLSDICLGLPFSVLNVDESALAEIPECHDAARNGDPLLALFQFLGVKPPNRLRPPVS